jgi:hypothetical protein
MECTNAEGLILNDSFSVTIDASEQSIKIDNWHLGYAFMVYSSQGLTMHAPKKVWIIDDYLIVFTLVYIVVSMVEYLSHYQRVPINRPALLGILEAKQPFC